MAHILGISKVGTSSSALSFDNINLGVLTDEYWYLESFIRYTNGYTDIDAGAFDEPIVTFDYGSF